MGNATPRQGSSGLRRWLLPVTLVAIGGLAAAWGDAGLELLRYDRAAISSGELWRLLSGHLVHLGWPHYLMNAIGLLLVWVLVANALTVGQWSFAFLLIVLTMDACFWFFDPQLSWYVGLSGVLHGLLILGLLLTLRQSLMENLALLVLIAAKLVYEQTLGPLPGSESTAGGSVVVNAHLYGAVAGLLLAGLHRIRVRTTRAI